MTRQLSNLLVLGGAYLWMCFVITMLIIALFFIRDISFIFDGCYLEIVLGIAILWCLAKKVDLKSHFSTNIYLLFYYTGWLPYVNFCNRLVQSQLFIQNALYLYIISCCWAVWHFVSWSKLSKSICIFILILTGAVLKISEQLP